MSNLIPLRGLTRCRPISADAARCACSTYSPTSTLLSFQSPQPPLLASHILSFQLVPSHARSLSGHLLQRAARPAPLASAVHSFFSSHLDYALRANPTLVTPAINTNLFVRHARSTVRSLSTRDPSRQQRRPTLVSAALSLLPLEERRGHYLYAHASRPHPSTASSSQDAGRLAKPLLTLRERPIPLQQGLQSSSVRAKMKVVTLVLTLTASGLVLAQPHAGGHHHGHAHMHQRHEGTNVVKRVASPVADSAIAVATVYMLAGKEISANEVQQGIANGTLIWADDGVLSSTNVAAPASSATPSIAQAADPAPAIGTGIKAQADNPSPTAAASTLITSAKAAASSSVDIFAPDPVTSSPAAASSLSSPAASLGGTGIDADFPDGQLDCSDFPDQYGALALNYLGLGGWTGIQSPGDQSSAGFSNIRTVVRSSCSGSNCCQEGQFCSYACPAGYQKSQWPSTQGSTGQSVGGIQCTGGKLYLTNKAMSSKLCMRGNTAVTVTVQNKMSEQASICRTDYPGTSRRSPRLLIQAC